MFGPVVLRLRGVSVRRGRRTVLVDLDLTVRRREDKNLRITEAVQRCGLSRSSYYKYKDDILPFYDDLKGKTLTIAMQMLDKPGLLSELLHLVADFNANILTIHQIIPVNGVASISLSVEVLEETGNIDNMIRDIEDCSGIYDVKILARK